MVTENESKEELLELLMKRVVCIEDGDSLV